MAVGTEPAQLGRYIIQSELGRGAMGVVYKATDSVLERPVAVKTVNITLERDRRQQPRSLFQRNILSIFPNGSECVGLAGPCAHVYGTRRVYIDIRVCGH